MILKIRDRLMYLASIPPPPLASLMVILISAVCLQHLSTKSNIVFMEKSVFIESLNITLYHFFSIAVNDRCILHIISWRMPILNILKTIWNQSLISVDFTLSDSIGKSPLSKVSYFLHPHLFIVADALTICLIVFLFLFLCTADYQFWTD